MTFIRSTDGTLIDPSDYRLALIDAAQVEVTSPNGGESWQLGTTQNIGTTGGAFRAWMPGGEVLTKKTP